ncbi:MAG: DNA alkylation repair protein [Candidatus Omnitrophica bacterium]|nr:DNA alkylation repair protein [Candidatus Omnitrophota bacterium]
MLNKLKKDLRAQADPEKAKILQRFFKTAAGEYGEGDVFLGLVVPKIRALSKKYAHLDIRNTEILLRSPIHEERLSALLILVLKFEKGSAREKAEIYRTYLKNTEYINSWDLVDLTADRIAGAFLKDRDKAILYKLARSENMWERRIAIIATFHFIKNGSFRHTFAIAKVLLSDDHDLIHKAVGWMLRETGKRIDMAAEERFLENYYKKMPRTMLRYAIERFPESKRKAYLKGRGPRT